MLIYIHKEEELDDVTKHYPAEHYVVVDDKARILTAVKEAWGDRVTTVFARQGKFAHDPRARATCPPPDLTVNRIDELLDVELAVLLRAGRTTGEDIVDDRGPGAGGTRGRGERVLLRRRARAAQDARAGGSGGHSPVTRPVGALIDSAL